MIALTPRMLECLELIKGYQAKNGIAPTVRELAGAMNISASSRIHTILAALEQRGHIRRLSKQARAIEIVPQLHACPNCGHRLAVAQ